MKKSTFLTFLISLVFVAVQAQISETSTPNLDIPDGDLANPATDIITISNATSDPVTDVTVAVRINHTWIGDLAITLTAPDGTVAELLMNPGTLDGTMFGCSQNNINAIFTDAGASVVEGACQSSAWDEATGNPGEETYAISGDWQANTQDGTAVDLSATFSTITDINGDWTLTVSDKANQDNGDLEEWTVNIFGPTLGLSEASIADFKVFPNPAQNTLNVRAGNTIDAIQVYNLIGQEVLRDNPSTSERQINISNLQRGIYIVQVTVEEVTETIRLIKR